MSNHILHQFDEQWLTDTVERDDERRSANFFNVLDETQDASPGADAAPALRRYQWLITLLALVLAAIALYFALDARRYADQLQQRFTTLEATKNK